MLWKIAAERLPIVILRPLRTRDHTQYPTTIRCIILKVQHLACRDTRTGIRPHSYATGNLKSHDGSADTADTRAWVEIHRRALVRTRAAFADHWPSDSDGQRPDGTSGGVWSRRYGGALKCKVRCIGTC